jgi:hypothetical protein
MEYKNVFVVLDTPTLLPIGVYSSLQEANGHCATHPSYCVLEIAMDASPTRAFQNVYEKRP